YSGSGEYAGIFVVLLAIWGIAHSFGRSEIFNKQEKQLVWFWSAMAVLSLLFAFGRHALFYEIIYAIPGVSAVRNPMKFMHPFHLCMILLFAYGLQSLFRRYVEGSANQASRTGQWKQFWASASVFERKWVTATFVTLAIAILFYLIYRGSIPSLSSFIQSQGFDEATARAIARFSMREVGWFVAFLALSIFLVAAVMSGKFKRVGFKWVPVAMGLLMIVDLARANQHWIIYYNYKDKYASNPIVDILRNQSHERRVTMFSMALPQGDYFSQLYAIEWIQHLFPFYNVQSIDIIQMPREPEDFAEFSGSTGAFPYRNGIMPPDKLNFLPRYWELTSTRFILAPAGLAERLNSGLDPTLNRFSDQQRFDVAGKPEVTQVTRLEDLTAVPRAEGKYSLIEFRGALPKAKLYTNWRTATNGQEVLNTLRSAEFNPQTSVIVQSDIPASSSQADETGTVAFRSYSPKHVELAADAKAPSVLLLNDKYHPDWKVWVNGEPAELFR
ncbi:MAG: hypothetical protein ACK4UN_20175, partial [Limisphaerales bacterium]